MTAYFKDRKAENLTLDQAIEWVSKQAVRAGFDCGQQAINDGWAYIA